MKFCLFYGFLLQLSVAMALDNVNSISCIYSQTKTGWKLMQPPQFKKQAVFLSQGEKMAVGGAQTWNGTGQPNYAGCTAMVGTESNKTVLVEGTVYVARYFETILGQNGPCAISGPGLQSRRGEVIIARGEVAEFQIPWYPNRSVMMKVYFPLENELARLSETADKKCEELMP